MSKENALSVDYPTVAAMVLGKAETHGDFPAITADGRTVTYAQMLDRSARCAAFLMGLGLTPGSRLVHIGKATQALFDIYMGAARVGISFVSLNFRLSPAEIAFQISDCGATQIFCDGCFLDLLADVDKSTVSIHQNDAADFEAGFMAVKPVPLPPVTPDTELMMMYTSGTTGKAKGVQVTQGSYMASRAGDGRMGDWSVYTAGDPMMVATPMFHIAGVGWALIGYYNAQHLFLQPDFVPDVILQSLIDNKIKRALFVPVMLAFMLQALEGKDTQFPDLKFIVYGASPITPSLLKAAVKRFGCGFVQVYGMTETNGAGSYLPPGDHLDPANPKFGCAGKPYINIQVEIRDDKGRALPMGETGEICLKTPSLMNGYLNRPEETDKVIEDGWYKTGDGGFLDADGYLHIRDRIKDMIISGGENVYPSEVEAAIAATGLTKDCAIVSAPDPQWGELIVLAAVPASADGLSIQALRASLKGQLADYKCPRKIMLYDQLPRNQSGKILRTALREDAKK